MESSSKKPGGIQSSEPNEDTDRAKPCIRIFEGHSKAVTALRFEDESLVISHTFCTSTEFNYAGRSPVLRTGHSVNGTLQLDSVS